jgi:class 3 adenylate cyclase/YHS domain-containing protein
MPTFLFADLAGFTALTEAHGDEEAINLVEEFFEAVRALLAEHQAEEVKTIGDAVMLRCEDPGKAIELGTRIVYEIGEQPGFPAVRVGLHTGPATERHGDWFGGTVNLAARVAGAASGGTVLLTEDTANRAGQLQGVALHEYGRVSLRNLPEPVRLLRASPKAPVSEQGKPIDPVCRMVVDLNHAAGSLRYEGTEYLFCSLRCAHAFAEAPEHFVKPRST